MKSREAITILYEDDHILLLDKPAGMPTLAASKDARDSLADELARRYPALATLEDCGIAHRLDNDTSGVMCVGKTQNAYRSLRNQFAQGTVEKRYCTLVVGSIADCGETHAPVAHHPRKADRMVVCDSLKRSHELNGREAHTRWQAIGRYHYIDRRGLVPYTLLDVTITTGVRHQIRAHLAWLGFPVAGDRLYQNPKKRAWDVIPLNRHFLHAHHLKIIHPETHLPLVIESKLPHDLKRILDLLTTA